MADSDEHITYRYPNSQHNGVSGILRVASKLGEAIEGKIKSKDTLEADIDSIPDICSKAFP